MNAVVCDRCGAVVGGGLVGHHGSMTCLRNRGWWRISYPYYPDDVILRTLVKVGAPHETVEMPELQTIIYAPRWIGEMFRERGVTYEELVGLMEEAIQYDLGPELAAWVDLGGDPVQYILDRRRANMLDESPAIDLNIVPDGTSKP